MTDEIARFEKAQKIDKAIAALDRADLTGPQAYASHLLTHGCEFCLEAAEDSIVDGGWGETYDRYEKPGSRRPPLAVCDQHAPETQALLGLSKGGPGGHVSIAVQLPDWARDLLGRRWKGLIGGSGSWLTLRFGVEGRRSGSAPDPIEAVASDQGGDGTVTLKLAGNPATIVAGKAGDSVSITIRHADFSSFYRAVYDYMDDPRYRFRDRNCADFSFQALQQLNVDLPNGAGLKEDTPQAWFAAVKAAVAAAGNDGLPERTTPPLDPPRFIHGPGGGAAPLSITGFLVFDEALHASNAIPPPASPLQRLSFDSGNIAGRTYRFPLSFVIHGPAGAHVTSASLQLLAGGKVVAAPKANAGLARALSRPLDAGGTLSVQAARGEGRPGFSIGVAALAKIDFPQWSHVSLKLQVKIGRQTASAPWGPIPNFIWFEALLRDMEICAEKFAKDCIQDSNARLKYIANATRTTERLLTQAYLHPEQLEALAREATEARNMLMMATRLATSAQSQLAAYLKKEKGISFEEALNRRMRRMYPGWKFQDLSGVQRRVVLRSVIMSAGRSNPIFNNIARFALPLASAALVLATAGIMFYHIWRAEDKIDATMNEVVIVGGQVAGMVLLPAAWGLVFAGPPGPFVAAGLYLIGGLIGASLAEASLALPEEDETLLMDWLGEDPPVPRPTPAPPPTPRRQRAFGVESTPSPVSDRLPAPPAPNAGEEMIETTHQVATGSVLHVLDACPALRSSSGEIVTQRLDPPLSLSDLSTVSERDLCGTCLRMLGHGSHFVFASEGAGQILEVYSDRLWLLRTGGLFRSGGAMEILGHLISDLAVLDADMWSSPRVLIFYEEALEYPSETLLQAGHIVHKLATIDGARQLAMAITSTLQLNLHR